jgi:ribosomal protein S27AE
VKISRTGSSVAIQIGEKAVTCGKCGYLFRELHVFSDRPFEKCPRCGDRGPFRKATHGDIDAYVTARVERQRIRLSDIPKLIALTLLVLGIAALITWAVVGDM